jgi:hypothetical protein
VLAVTTVPDRPTRPKTAVSTPAPAATSAPQPPGPKLPPGAKPELVAEVLRQIPSDYPPDQVTVQAATTLAARDLPAALAWAESLPDEADKKRALAAALQQWATTQPEAALNFALQKRTRGAVPSATEATDPLTLDKVIDATVAAWLQADPAKAIAWARGLAETEARADMLRAMALSLEALPPAQAAPLAMQLPEGFRDPILTDIAFRWAMHEMPGAVGWLRELPEGGLKTNTTRSVAVVMVQQSPALMAQWLVTLPPGDSRDGAVEVFVESTAASDPAAAARLAATISDPAQRTKSVEQASTEWLRVDKAAATKWLRETTALEEAGKAKILGPQ